MNRKAEVELEFGDGPHVFALKIEQIEELQDKCGGVGFGLIAKRLMSNDYKVQDVFETLRLGLIGGGMPAIPARDLARRYILPLAHPEDPASPLVTAQVVVQAVLFGVADLVKEDDPNEGKSEAATTGS